MIIIVKMMMIKIASSVNFLYVTDAHLTNDIRHNPFSKAVFKNRPT